MKMVRIRENTIVNPEMISEIDFIVVNNKRSCVITMSTGKQIMATIPVENLLTDLINSGMEANSQFFAG